MIRNYLVLFLSLILCISLLEISFLPRAAYYVAIIASLAIIYSQQKIIDPLVINKLMISYVVLCGLNVLIIYSDPIFDKEARFILFFVVLISFSNIIETRKTAEIRSLYYHYFNNIFYILVILSIFFMLLGFIPIRSSTGTGSGFKGIFNHQNTLGPVAAFSFLYLISKYYSRLNILRFGLIFLCVLAVLLSASRASLLSMIIAFVFFIFIKRRSIYYIIVKNKYLFIFLIGISLVSLFTIGSKFLELSILNPILEKNEYAESQDDAFASRAFLWDLRLQEFNSNPLFGVGFGSTDIYLFRNGLSNNVSIEEGTVETGSSWLGQFSMLGLVGVLPLFLFISRLSFLYKRIWFNDYALLVFLQMIFLLIHGIFEGNLLGVGSPLVLFFWLLLGISSSKYIID